MLLRAMAAEWLKQRRTATGWLVLLMPAALALALTWYQSHRDLGSQGWLQLFNGLFQTWSCLTLPVGAGLLTGLSASQERQAGGWNSLRMRPISPATLYLSKLLLLTLHVAIATLVAALLTLLGGHWLGIADGVPWAPFLTATLLMLIAALPLLALHHWIATAYGFGPSIALAGSGLLLAALFGGTNLGDQVWQYLPWAWPVRIVSLAALRLPSIDPPLLPADFSVAAKAATLLLPALALAAVLTLGGLLWFARWEPPSHEPL